MPPPVRGDRGVRFLPSAGWPLGLNTKLKLLEFGVPWNVLFVTHAYPRLSNTMFPGPLIRKSGSSLPESLTLTVTVQASGLVTSGGAYKLLSNVSAKIASTFCPGSRARFANASAVLCGGRPPGGVGRSKRLAVTSGSLTHDASKLASDRVERSEFVWSAFGEFNSTGDDSPVAGAAMLSFLPRVIR